MAAQKLHEPDPTTTDPPPNDAPSTTTHPAYKLQPPRKVPLASERLTLLPQMPLPPLVRVLASSTQLPLRPSHSCPLGALPRGLLTGKAFAFAFA